MQISIIDGFMRCKTIINLELSVVFPCILLKIAHTVRAQTDFSSQTRQGNQKEE